MSDLLSRIQRLVHDRHVQVSEHGYDELADDGLSAMELLDGLTDAVIVEQYPDYPTLHPAASIR